jgi:hypothetical protein
VFKGIERKVSLDLRQIGAIPEAFSICSYNRLVGAIQKIPKQQPKADLVHRRKIQHKSLSRDLGSAFAVPTKKELEYFTNMPALI